MSRLTAFLFCCGLISLAGCMGSATTSPPVENVTPTTTDFKTVIQSIAATGEVGSNGPELSAKFDELKAKDAAKAEAVRPEFEELMKTDNPAKVKQLASDIAKKL